MGVAEVLDEMRPEEGGDRVTIIEVSPAAATLRRATTDPESADYLVRVRWLHSVDPKEAVRERGFFGNQNSVARPRTPKWNHTVERLKERFKVS